MIKAVQTEYNGYKFRSRLEARWAVFFDTLGIEYEYEPIYRYDILYARKPYTPDLSSVREKKSFILNILALAKTGKTIGTVRMN